METKNLKLKKLKIRLEELKPIVSVGFKTSEELDLYKKENEKVFNEYYTTYNQIRALEWDLMTPEQQARAKEVEYLVKLKTGQIKEEE